MTTLLHITIGALTWALLKHLYRGAQMWRRQRQAQRLENLQAWRRARIAGARLTLPTEDTSDDIPYLGIDVPVFAERGKDSA